MAIISIELWCTSVEKVGRYWIAQANSVLVTLNIDDINNDGLIDGSEWDAYTPGAGGKSNGLDQGSDTALYDGSSSNVGLLYTAVPISAGDDVSDIMKPLSNNFSADPDNLGDVVCFARGTGILTDRGRVRVEELVIGDRLVTMDNGLQPIEWVGMQRVPAVGRLAPIRFAPGTLGNDRPLLLSPQHRVLQKGWRAELMFGAHEVLVPAKALINGRSIRPVEGGMVEYFHVLLPSHEIIFANGAPAESLLLSSYTLDVLGDGEHDDLIDLYPSLLQGGEVIQRPTSRPVLRSYEAQALAAA